MSFFIAAPGVECNLSYCKKDKPILPYAERGILPTPPVRPKRTPSSRVFHAEGCGDAARAEGHRGGARPLQRHVALAPPAVRARRQTRRDDRLLREPERGGERILKTKYPGPGAARRVPRRRDGRPSDRGLSPRGGRKVPHAHASPGVEVPRDARPGRVERERRRRKRRRASAARGRLRRGVVREFRRVRSRRRVRDGDS